MGRRFRSRRCTLLGNGSEFPPLVKVRREREGWRERIRDRLWREGEWRRGYKMARRENVYEKDDERKKEETEGMKDWKKEGKEGIVMEGKDK